MNDDPDEWRTRINLALVILQQRPRTELTCELAVLALRGATVENLYEYEKAAVA